MGDSFFGNQDLKDIKTLSLPATTATEGIIFLGGNLFAHAFGSNNSFFGLAAGNLTLSGSNCTAVGVGSLANLTSGSQNVSVGGGTLNANTTGLNGTAIGFQSLNSNSTGNGNTCVGAQTMNANSTGSNNVALGTNAGIANTTGSGNVFIGANADLGSGTQRTNAIAIGFNATVDQDNAMSLGNGVDVGIGTSTPKSRLHVNGSQTVKRTAVGTGAYTVLATDYIVAKTAITGGGDTVTLPAAATAGAGKVYHIKDESGTAGANNITIDGDGAETIDGAASKLITVNFGSASIYTDGTNWFVI